MRYRVFTYGITPDEELIELNNFLTSRRVLSVRHELTVKDGSPYLLFIVEFIESGNAHKPPDRPPKIDYREKLSEEDFEVFSRLRDLRKEIAEREGVPVYSIFTNAQIAEMVERRVKTMTSLQDIPGIGAGKTEKYGGEFLDMCGKLLSDGDREDDETER
ncbi:HRDC domain-containing protein [bacterium]|nr:HRDC domain-containing protein [bacterium]